jgi:hypothetical protein
MGTGAVGSAVPARPLPRALPAFPIANRKNGNLNTGALVCWRACAPKPKALRCDENAEPLALRKPSGTSIGALDVVSRW